MNASLLKMEYQIDLCFKDEQKEVKLNMNLMRYNRMKQRQEVEVEEMLNKLDGVNYFSFTDLEDTYYWGLKYITGNSLISRLRIITR